MNKEKIVMIDDEVFDLWWLVEFFECLGYEVKAYQNVDQFLDDNRGKPLEVIIIDFLFHEATKTIRVLKELYPTVKIVVLSGWARNIEASALIREGVIKGFVVKGDSEKSKEELLNIIKSK